MTTKQLPDLSGFTGTEGYYRHWFGGYVYTDGVKFLATECDAFWLIDAVLSYQRSKQIRENESLLVIQFWKLVAKDGKATLTCREDSGIPPAITQEIEFTTFPDGEVELWFENNTLYLPSER